MWPNPQEIAVILLDTLTAMHRETSNLTRGPADGFVITNSSFN